MSYDTDKRKLYHNWTQLTQTEKTVNLLKSDLIRIVPLNYNKKIGNYTIYEGAIPNDTPIIFKVELYQVPEIVLPYIKILSVSNEVITEIDAYNILFLGNIDNPITLYIYYQGETTSLKLILNVIVPQEYN
jgi:hypothetical protein